MDTLRENEWARLWAALEEADHWLPCIPWRLRIERFATLGDFLRGSRGFASYDREEVRFWLWAEALIKLDVGWRSRADKPLTDAEIDEALATVRKWVGE